jgi:hypothetical protein
MGHEYPSHEATTHPWLSAAAELRKQIQPGGQV